MIEIIPNWHPIFVHFTIALFVSSVLFLCLAYLLNQCTLASEFIIVARWCLWVCALITIGTVTLGFYAYYTVAHDTPSHIVMTAHRNWAIATASLIAIVTIWSWVLYRANKTKPNIAFISTLLIGLVLLAVTAWHGGELVYRYGIGVKSLPKTSIGGHKHDHGLQKPRHDNPHHNHNH